MNELESILSDAPEVEESQSEEAIEEASTGEQEAVEEPEAEATEETQEEEADEESKAEPEEDSKDSTPEPKKDENNWQFEAYKDEKRKRQELEKKLEELQKPKEPEKAPDVLDDQEGFTNHIQNYVQQQLMNERTNLSQAMAEREYGKDVVAQKLEVFKEMLADDPSLQSRIISSVSPYHEMVDVVNKAEKLKQLDNVEDMEAKIRADIEAKIRAEYESKLSDKNAKRESVTPSLNSKASSSNEKPDDTLESLLSGR